MRILGFSKKWAKLEQERFTTFRFPRKDRDWEPGEQVQIVYKPRSKNREPLGDAQIVKIERRVFPVTDEEAIADGFKDASDMAFWFRQAHGDRIDYETVNKVTLEWMHRAQAAGATVE